MVLDHSSAVLSDRSSAVFGDCSSAVLGDCSSAVFGPIAIGFSTQKWNPISALMRLITGSRASHVWVLANLFGVPCVIEASEKGFLPSMTFEKFSKKNEVIALIPIAQSLDVGLRWAAKNFGDAYDYTGLFGMVWVMLGRFFHRRWKNPIDSRKALFCSEAITKVLCVSSFPGADRLVAEETTPEQLLRLLERTVAAKSGLREV